MTDAELDIQKKKMDAAVAAKDRRQRHQDAVLGAATNVIGSVVKGVTSMGNRALKDAAAKQAFKHGAEKAVKKVSKFPLSRFSDNDPEWYKRLPGLTKVNTMIPDFQIIGHRDLAIRPQTMAGVPAIYRVNYAPVIGTTGTQIERNKVVDALYGNDPFNRALNRVVTQLENRNSRVSSYTRDTVGRYLFIATDILQDILRLKMAIEWYDKSESQIPYLSQMMIEALGFNYADFKDNIASIKAFYVSIATEFNKGLPLPADLAYVRRKVFLSTLVAKDSEGEYSSLIIFNKAVDYEFPSASSSISPDIYESHQQIDYHYLSYTTKLRIRIKTLVTGATWKPLIRDLRGSTKSEMWYQLPEDVDTSLLNITASREIRNQIHNITMFPCLPVASGLNNMGMVESSFSISGSTDETVRQGCAGVLPLVGGLSTYVPFGWLPGVTLLEYTSLATQGAATLELRSKIIGADLSSANAITPHFVYNQYDEFTGDSVLVGTRLTSLWGVDKLDAGTTHTAYSIPVIDGDGQQSALSANANENKLYVIVAPVACGTELCLNMDTLPFGASPCAAKWLARPTESNCNFDVNNIMRWSNYIAFNESNGVCAYAFMAASVMSILDWAPIIYSYCADNELDPTAANCQGYSVIGELDHYTPFDAQTLYRLHCQCVESEMTIGDEFYLKPLQ